MYTKTDICNLALARLGDKRDIENIDNPTNQPEKVFAKWYDISRRAALRTMMPSFARTRKLWAKAEYTPEFGYAFAYKYRQDCLKVLGIGNLNEPINDYAVEEGYVLTNQNYENGLPVRYVKDVTDINKFDDAFVELFSLMLAYNVAPELTESRAIVQHLEQIIPIKTAQVIAVDSQENKPIIVKTSRLLAGRRGIQLRELKH